MQACILHYKSVSVQTLRDLLLGENIKSVDHTWNGNVLNTWQTISGCSAVIAYVNKSQRPLFLSPVRAQYTSIPIIVVDEHPTEKRRIWCEQHGTDLYFSASSPPCDIAIEIKRLLSKKQLQIRSKWIKAFNVRLDINQHKAARGTYAIFLRNKEFSLLEFLVLNRGKILTRDMILENVWDRNATFSSNTVDVHINRLRRKLDDPFKEKLIHTVHCLGYIFDRKKPGSATA